MTSARRVTYPTAAILMAIRRGHRYGFDIMDATGLPDGTIYPALRRMEDRELLTADWEDAEEARDRGRPPRRYYDLTPAGLEAVEEAAERYPALRGLFPGGDEDPELATT